MSNIIGFPDGAGESGEEKKSRGVSFFVSRAFPMRRQSVLPGLELHACPDGRYPWDRGAEVHAAQLEIVCGDIERIVDGEGGTGFFRHILLPLPHFFPARKTGRSGHGKNAAVDKGQTGGFQIRSDAFNQVIQVGAVRQSVFDAGNVPCVSFPCCHTMAFRTGACPCFFRASIPLRTVRSNLTNSSPCLS